MKTDMRDLMAEKKSWEEIRACREKFELETEREIILRVYKWVLWNICDYWFTTSAYRWRMRPLKIKIWMRTLVWYR